AEAALAQGRKTEAETLLARCVTLAPDFQSARFNYATVLLQLGDMPASLVQVEQLLEADPRNPVFRRLKAKVLYALGNHENSAACWRSLLDDYPDRPECWVGYGNAMRSLARSAESVAAYRKAIEIRPTQGVAYWSLANLKTFRFDDAMIRQ